MLVGLQECGNDDPNLTIQALLLIPAALADVNAWWELPRLLPNVTRLVERGGLAQDGPEAANLWAAARRLIEASAERRDCTEAVGRLRCALAEEDQVAGNPQPHRKEVSV